MLKIVNVRPALNVLCLAAVMIVAGCATAKPEKAVMAEAAPAAPTEPSVTMVMKEVVLDTTALFVFDSAKLTAEGMAAIDKLVMDAGGKDAGRISVTGHADRIGEDNYNMGLSERRANTVADYMVSRGVPAGSISRSGKGESQPVVQCADTNWRALVQCLAPNRRVVVQYPVMIEEEVIIQN